MATNKSYTIAILSGKGGTGKTLVSVNLATIADNARYIDCDVEEPNGHLFLKPQNVIKENIDIKVPVVNNVICNGCKKCVDFCNFNALAYINVVFLFEEICHSCGGCKIVCPVNAINEKNKTIGFIEKGDTGNVSVVSGIMNVGEVSGAPIIGEIYKYINNDKVFNFIDCPPGSACLVMDSIKKADFCVFVTEPTSFGVHNLNMVYNLIKLFKKPYGVVINKWMEGDTYAEDFCKENNIKILGKIPFDKDLGKLNSESKIAVNESEKYKKMFSEIFENIKKEAKI